MVGLLFHTEQWGIQLLMYAPLGGLALKFKHLRVRRRHPLDGWIHSYGAVGKTIVIMRPRGAKEESERHYR